MSDDWFSVNPANTSYSKHNAMDNTMTYRFVWSILSDSSQSRKILRPWNVFRVSDLNTTFGSGFSMCSGV